MVPDYGAMELFRSIIWLVNVSYGVHWDSKGHTGAMMSMGKSTVINILRNHRMNVVISIEGH